MQIPWRAAPRAALSSPLTLVVSIATTLLLSFVVAAAVLHGSSAGSAAMTYQEGRLCEQSVHPVLDGNTGFDAARGAAEKAVREAGDQPVLAGFYTGVGRPDFGGLATYGRFGFREGATDHLTVLQGGSKDGVWVPESIAKAAKVELGDRGENGALPPVTAIYADLSHPVDEWWCSEARQVVPNPIGGDGESASVIWMPSLDSMKAVLAGHERVALTVRFPQAELPRTIAEADALRVKGNALLARIGAPVTRSDYLKKPVEVAGMAGGNVGSAILPLTAISLLIGLAGVGTVTLQWVQRRHGELRMLWCRGSGPLALGGRAVLELGLPLVLGGALGLVAARLLLPVYAPSTALAAGAVLDASIWVLGVAVASLLVVVAVATWKTHRTFQGRPVVLRRRWVSAVPWELLTAGLAVFSWNQLVRNGLGTSEKGSSLPTIDTAALAFPLLVVLTTALVAARVLRLSLGWSHHANMWSRPAAQLAVRRLAAAAGPVTGVLLVGVLAIGTIAVGSSVAAAQKSSLAEKSGRFVGANSTVQVSQDLALGRIAIPEPLRGNTTLVGVSDKTLVVDPATFTDGAYLGDTSPDEVRSALNGLKKTGDFAPALRIGRSSTTEIRVPGLPLLRPGPQLPTFPKLGTRGYVIQRDSVPGLEQVGSWHLWSTLPMTELTAALRTAGVHYTNVQDRATVLDGLPFLIVQWTFGFVAAVGAVLAVVAAIALLLAIEVRRRQNAVSGALSTRMGLRPAMLLSSHLMELGALAAFAVVVGSTASAVSTGFAVPELDPAPWLNPAPVLPNLAPLLLTTVAGSMLVVFAAAWLALRSARVARIGELIRG
ncbi:ABC transporter permease [Lentzea tibetensis]|uniref:ABC transporter permease n=1 Tax=Lentzea tibetensis TaxID=2591470 RepID=A0A563EWH9_9PSEU|nr:ABC transporter permease [Lentzea tibetensis]TWP52029.1 ABC transporter permease [Lentzea tibetensis]